MIEITDNARDQLLEIMERESKKGHGLKVAVKGGGCSGLSYSMDLSEEPEAGDKVIENNEIRVFMDLGSSLYLSGTVLDFSDGLNGAGFTFNNPNATRTCGCGQSFSA